MDETDFLSGALTARAQPPTPSRPAPPSPHASPRRRARREIIKMTFWVSACAGYLAFMRSSMLAYELTW